MAFFQHPRSSPSGRLGSLCDCPDPSTISSIIPDSRFEDIARVLATEVQSPSWVSRPRTYFILWQIKRVDAMESFIAKGLNDTSLPYSSRRSLPETLTPYEAGDFLKWQGLVFCDVLHLEKGKHVSISNGDTLFEQTRTQLGVGSQGYVSISLCFSCRLV
jgi:hypothetical protein